MCRRVTESKQTRKATKDRRFRNKLSDSFCESAVIGELYVCHSGAKTSSTRCECDVNCIRVT